MQHLVQMIKTLSLYHSQSSEATLHEAKTAHEHAAKPVCGPSKTKAYDFLSKLENQVPGLKEVSFQYVKFDNDHCELIQNSAFEYNHGVIGNEEQTMETFKYVFLKVSSGNMC